MKRSLIYFFVLTILLNTPATLFCQKQGSLLIKGQDISASPASLQILKGGVLKDSLYTIPVQNGNFYALLDLDEGIQQVAVLIGKKPVFFYESSGEVVDITCDFTKSSLIKIQGSNTLKTQLLSYDASEIVSARRDSVFAYIINKAADDAEKYRLCAYYYYMELYDLLSKKNIFKQEMEQYINELYFSYANKMSTYGLYLIEHLSDTSAIRFHDNKIVPGARHFEQESKKIFLQSPAYRQYLFNNFRFGKSDSSDAQLMIKYSGDVKKAAPWKEYHKSKYIDNPFIKDWFKAKSVVFSFNHYNLEEADKVMKLFLTECQYDQLKENVINSVKEVSIFKNGIKAPNFVLQNELGRTVSLTDFTGKVIYLNFWGIHCGPCINEIKNDLPLLRNKYKNIVIINICIEGKIAEWKNAITKYGMKDINLYDPLNKVAKLYSISSVPHNILIDKQSKIFDYNAAAPDVYIKSNSSIDELTK
jgi:thiol-disulfide isomerase/thioredoxin